MLFLLRAFGIILGLIHMFVPILGIIFNPDYIFVGHEVTGIEALWISYLFLLGLLLVLPFSKLRRYFYVLFICLVILASPEIIFFSLGVYANIIDNPIVANPGALRAVVFLSLSTILASNIAIIWKQRPKSVG